MHQARGTPGSSSMFPRLPLMLLLSVMAVAVPYLAGVIAPYYALGLGGLPIDALKNGAYDPEVWFPVSSVPGVAYFQVAGLLAGLIGLMLLPLAVLVAFVALLPAWRLTGKERRMHALVLLVAVPTLLVMMSPRGLAITTWLMD